MLEELKQIVDTAHKKILSVYDSEFETKTKNNHTPVTAADLLANETILSGLDQLDPGTPVLSEEAKIPSFEVRRQWSRYWLIDPLDGTRDFIKRTGQFTVNVALVENNKPTLGVVGVPTKNTIYTGQVKEGLSYRSDRNGTVRISAVSSNKSKIRIFKSRHHAHDENRRLIELLESEGTEVDSEVMGSSLKACLIAEGLADLYVRFGPTNEWDTAAAGAVLEAAGGGIYDLDGQPLTYNLKPSLLNPPFLACHSHPKKWIERVKQVQRE